MDAEVSLTRLLPQKVTKKAVRKKKVTEEAMARSRRRPTGRLFYLLLVGSMLFPVMLQGAPATTTISDVVYRADGTPAAGVLLISWPAFTTSAGAAVGAGTQSVKLGPDGTLLVQLVPNVNASPASTLYSVVFQLDDGTAKTEYWMVGTASPTTIAAVRMTPGATRTATQLSTA